MRFVYLSTVFIGTLIGHTKCHLLSRSDLNGSAILFSSTVVVAYNVLSKYSLTIPVDVVLIPSIS